MLKILKRISNQNKQGIKSLLFKFFGYFILFLFSYLLNNYNKNLFGEFNIYLKLISILSVFILLGSQTVIVKYSSIYYRNKDFFNIEHLLKKSSKNSFERSVFFVFIFFIVVLSYEYIFEKELISIYKLTLLSLILILNILVKIYSYFILSVGKVWKSHLNDNSIPILFSFFILIICIFFNKGFGIELLLFGLISGKILIYLFFNYELQFISPNKKSSINQINFNNYNKYITPTNILGEVQRNLDIIIIGFFLTLEHVALYSLLLLVSTAIQVFLQILNSTFTSDIAYNFSKYNNLIKLQKNTIILYSLGFTISLIFSFLMFFCFKFYFLSSFTLEFQETGLITLIILSSAQCYNVITGFSGLSLTLCRGEKKHFYISLFSFSFYLVLLIISTLKIGIIGSALAMLFFQVLSNSLKLYHSIKYFKK